MRVNKASRIFKPDPPQISVLVVSLSESHTHELGFMGLVHFSQSYMRKYFLGKYHLCRGCKETPKQTKFIGILNVSTMVHVCLIHIDICIYVHCTEYVCAIYILTQKAICNHSYCIL